MTSTTVRGKRDYPIAFGLGFIHLGALAVLIPALFSWQAVGAAVLLYWVTGFGITLGFHRILTHRSLAMPRWFEYVVITLGTLALQGGPIEWVAQHRAHHAHTDAEGDPHNAHRGMPWAHVEWLFRRNDARLAESEWPRWARDIAQDPYYRFLQKTFVLWQVALGALLLAIGGWPFVVWGIFARLVFTYHCTWLVNSASHAAGYQTFRTGDLSTNNWLVAIFTFGEGWHNNHHAFPFSARHGLKWFEFDVTFVIIKVLGWFKLVRNVKIPTREMMERLKFPQPVWLPDSNKGLPQA